MLRFIYLADYNKGLAIKFQYISCYGLSAAFSSLAIISPRFQYISCYGLSSFKECEDAKQIIFQYISCYGLSGFRGNESGWNFAFQYISCYGLSTCYHAYMRYIVISIHLMLRFIWRIPHWNLGQPCISIHLLLRFIHRAESDYPARKKFQYISCYGLST